MKILAEFREFISRGSVIDLAVGVIVGAAFSKIVTSLVDQVVMPPIGVVMGGVDFSQLKLVLIHADKAAGRPETAVLYGAFINTVIQFVIVAAAVFLLVKLVNSVRRHAPQTPAAPTPSEALLVEIRDLLRAQAGAGAKAPVPAPAKPAPAKAPARKR